MVEGVTVVLVNVYIPPEQSRYGPTSLWEYTDSLDGIQTWVHAVHLKWGVV